MGWGRFGVLAGVVQGLIPGLSRMWSGIGFAGNDGDATSICFVTCCFLGSVPMYIVLMTFLTVGISDKQRKQLIMRRLGKMLTIRAATLRLPTGELVESHHRYPRIDDTPHAMQSWLLCRLVLHDYGAGMAYRLAIYLAIALLFIVIQGAWLLILLVASMPSSDLARSPRADI